MFCSRCGNHVENETNYCNKCGNFLGENVNNVFIQPQFEQNPRVNNLNQNEPFAVYNIDNSVNVVKKKNNKKTVLIGVGSGLVLLIFIVIVVALFSSNKSNYYFSTNEDYNNENNTTVTENRNNSKPGKYQTVIVVDNTYSGIKISNTNDAYKLIEKDSVSQKSKCPSEIKKIENEIIEKYNITAVNLCEMDVNFAKELENVFEVIYRDYPTARGYITNLTLKNTNIMSENGVIAAFMPIFNFATSDSDSSYPWVMKTQVLLSSDFFLNKSKLESSTASGSASGHFPPNSTIYSPLAHELGHYLSFLAMMRYYKIDSVLLIDNSNLDKFYKLYSDFTKGNYSLSMIKEAYNNYKRDTNTTMNMDEWRGTISKYALAKNNSGEYIYDETIAEAFHDVYLNNDKARDASKYIVKVLKEKLES